MSRPSKLASLVAPFLFATAVATVAPEAWADDLEQAKQWVAEGDKAGAAHDYPTAIEKYKLALKVKETAALYLRLGLVQEEAGALADALITYRLAKPLAVGNDKVAPVVDKQIEQLEPRVPHLRMTFSQPPPPGIRVEVNRQVITDFGDIRVNPGQVEVHATAPNMQEVTNRVNVGMGESVTVDVVLLPFVVAPPPPPPPPPPSPSIPGIVLVSAAPVVLGVSIGLVVRGFGIESGIKNDAGCPLGDGGFDYTRCTDLTKVGGPAATATNDEKRAFGADLSAESNAFKASGFVLLGVGVAAGVTGGVLLGLSLKKKSPSPTMSVVPVVGPETFGAVAGGTF